MTPNLPPVLPGNLPPFPAVPEGHSHWEYRGKGYDSTIPCVYAGFFEQFPEDGWRAIPDAPETLRGNVDAHYIEAIPIARANGIGGEPTNDPCESESPKPEEIRFADMTELVKEDEPTPPKPERVTPITDSCTDTLFAGRYVPAILARQLESDLAAAREELDRSRFLHDELLHHHGEVVQRASDEVKRLRATLEENTKRWVERECKCDPDRRGTRCHRCTSIAENEAAHAPASSGKGEG